MNNLYIYSPDVMWKAEKWSYGDFAKNEMQLNSGEGIYQAIHQVSEPFEFLKIIELFNRQIGQVDNLIVAAEMWPYGVKLLADGESKEHWLKIENFYEYPHDWKIVNVKLIGCNVNKKVKEDRETFAEALLDIVTGKVEYYRYDTIDHVHDLEFESIKKKEV